MIRVENRSSILRFFSFSLWAGFIFYTVLVVLFWNYTVDDSYISYRYAENLAGGRGLTFNPGERVEGYSNFLWVTILSLCARGGMDPLRASKALGLLSGWGLLFLAWKWSGEPERKTVGLLWILALASSLPLAVWAASGMETVFYTLLITAGLLSGAQGRQSTAGPFLLGLAAVTRPEGILFTALGGGVLLYRWRAYRRPLVCAALLFFPFAFQVMFRKWYYGTWLTNTFHAKMGLSAEIWLKGLVYGRDFFASWGPLAVLWLLVAPGWVRLWRKDRLLSLKAVVAIGLQSAFIVAAGGDWMKPFRFWVPVLPCLFLFLAEGYEALRERWSGPGREALLAGGMAVLVGMGNLWAWPQVRRYTAIYSDGMQRTSVALGLWLAQNAEPGAWVALGDAGALPYYSGLRVIDLYGLMNPEIARLPGPALYSEGIDTASILARKPDYVVLESHEESRFEGIKPVDRKLYLEPGFQSAYGLIQKARFSPREVSWLFQRRERE